MIYRYFLAVLLAFVAGCSNSSAPTAPKKLDLGVVNLTYDTPSKHEAGNGYSVDILARSLNSKTQCELIVEFKKNGKVIDTQRHLPGPLDQPAQFGVENFDVTFTPHIGQ